MIYKILINKIILKIKAKMSKIKHKITVHNQAFYFYGDTTYSSTFKNIIILDHVINIILLSLTSDLSVTILEIQPADDPFAVLNKPQAPVKDYADSAADNASLPTKSEYN